MEKILRTKKENGQDWVLVSFKHYPSQVHQFLDVSKILMTLELNPHPSLSGIWSQALLVKLPEAQNFPHNLKFGFSLTDGYYGVTWSMKKIGRFQRRQWLLTMATSNPNDYSQVKILNNPIKTITCRHKFDNSETVLQCKIFKELLDLGQGVWQVSVQSVLISNIAKTKLATVFDLKTNLSSSYKQVQGQAVSVNETLTSIQCRCNASDFVLFNPTQVIFFTLNNRPNDHFKVIFAENELMKAKKAIYQVEVEIRFLFQRMI